MVNVNAPAANDEGIEKNSKESVQNIHKLYKSGLARTLFDEQGNIDPEKFDTYKKDPNRLKSEIPKAMKELRYADMVNYGQLDENEIDIYISYNAINLNEELVRFGMPLIQERKKFRDRSLELFPELRNIQDFESQVKESIDFMNLDELKKYTQRSSNLRSFLKNNEFFGPELSTSALDIRSEFKDDIDIFFSDPNKKESLEQMFRNYEQLGYSPDQKDIDFLIGVYLYNPNVQIPEGKRSERLKAIFTFFGAQISLKDAYDRFKWIDHTDAEKFIRVDPDLAILYDTLSQEERIRLRARILSDSDIMISARDLDFSRLSGILKKNKKQRQALISSLVRNIDIEKRESEKSKDVDISLRIRQRILKDNTEDGGDNYNYDVFEEYKNQVLNHEPSFRQAGEFPVKNFKNFREGSYILLENGESPILARLNSTRDSKGYPGLVIEYYSVDKNGIADQPVTSEYDYDTFTKILGSALKGGKVFTEDEFNEKIRTDKISEAGEANSHTKKQIFIKPSYLGDGDQSNPAEMYINTPEALVQELDMIDVAGNKYGFGVGTSFIAPSVEEGTKKVNHDDIWTVSKIGNGVVSLIDSDGNQQLVKDFPIHSLYTILASTTGFRRIGLIANDIDFVNQLKSVEGIGIDGDVTLKDARLLTKQKDEHGHETEKYITTLAGEKGGHIRLGEIRDGVVYFGDYKDGEDIQKVKEYAKKHGLDKKLKGYYDWRSMSYPAFIEYCKKHKLKKSSKDPILPQEAAHDFHGDDHHDHSHLEGSFLKKIMKLQNPASIMKGFEMIGHAIEHTLEKGAKLDAARFALGTSRFLHLPASVNAQIYADVVEGSKEIVEKYEKKIFGLPGPAQRWKCIHIAHDSDSRPEEVAAAISVMMKSYGQLYSEDIKHYQSTVNEHNLTHKPAGYFAFFDALILTSKVPGGLIEWRKKAYSKAVTEMGTEDDHEGEPTEEQLIHALFKNIDGNWDKYPYAASVIKALGGPSGYEKIWKFEGFDTAFKKGKDQTQMVSAQGRLHKAVSYLGTFEIYKAMGAMEAVAAKVKEPEFQAMPFIWAVGGFSRYASHTALQKIKGYAENGLSFHAYSFLRNHSDNNTYKKMVEMALNEIGGKGLVDEFQGIVKRLEFDQDNEESTKGAAMDMMRFWQRNCHRGLHDILQGQNGWLLKLRNEGNETATNYWSTFVSKHAQQLKDGSIPGTDFGKDWYDEHGYQNVIMSEIEGKDKKKYRSVHSMLNKIRFEGGSIGGGARAMNDIHREKIWFYIKKYMNGSLRDANMFQDEELMKEQYLVHRKEILEYFAQQLGARNPGNISPEQFQANLKNHIRTYPYYQDLEDMGISPEAVFSADIQSSSEDADYRRWRSGQKSSGSTRGSASLSVMNKINGNVTHTTESVKGLNTLATPIHDDDSRPPPANADVFEQPD